eukprot:TRINITY_DN95598_c0_g1_i1.p1 TRINITY_DN95598_c0_g1~~TRINITY_DN95598_c0_g1_i1.p1  ORF type:complete len:470 (+),score=101.08 TRINITY_DN95598_c0_g1_i1:56-1465(+)
MGQGQSGENLPQEGDEGTMKAYVMEAPGRLGDLKLVDVYVPKPEKGEIRVKVFAAGINPVDYKRCQAAEAEFPCIIGSDVAGVVDEVAPDVTNWKPGDKVYYHCNIRRQYGAFAEYSITNAATVCALPDGLSFSEAAAIPCSGWTAFIALYYKLRVQSGETILITGASGGVGSFAVQLAKLSGLTVYACTAPHKHDYIKGLGADYTLSSADHAEDLQQSILSLNGGKLLDHVLDVVGAKSAADCLKFLKMGGSICSLAGPVAAGSEFYQAGVSVHYLNLGNMHHKEEGHPMIQTVGRDLGAFFSRKQLVVPFEEGTFDQIPFALENLQLHQVKGKLVSVLVPEKKQEQEIQDIIAHAEQVAQEAQLAAQQAAAAVPAGAVPQQGVIPQQQLVQQPIAQQAVAGVPPAVVQQQPVAAQPVLPTTTQQVLPPTAVPTTGAAVYPPTTTPVTAPAQQQQPPPPQKKSGGWLW